MNTNKIKEAIEARTNASVLINEPMSKHTSMRIGGNAKIFVSIYKEEDLKEIIKISKEENLPIFVLGNGTNIIVKDGELNMLVLKLELKDINYKEEDSEGNNYVEAYAGVQLKTLVYDLAKRGLGPISCLYGIPATIGGALKMNAGAYGIEMEDIVYETTYMDLDGNIKTLLLDEHNFGYRQSFFIDNDVIIIKTILRLQKVDPEIELKKALETMQTRKDRQPLDYPNSGSVFKQGEDFYASKEIDDAGLKGFQIGGLAVSEKHAGFIINKGNATYKDFKELIEHIQKTVKENSGKILELENIQIGDE